MAIPEKARKRGLVLAMGTLGGLVMLDETILGVSLSAIRSEMGLSPTVTHWIINAYMLTFMCFAAIGGKAIDLFGLRPALVVSGYCLRRSKSPGRVRGRCDHAHQHARRSGPVRGDPLPDDLCRSHAHLR